MPKGGVSECGGPSEKPNERTAIGRDKTGEPGWSDVIGVEEPAVISGYAVRFHASAQERGAPRGERVPPTQAPAHEQHTRPRVYVSDLRAASAAS